MDFDYLFPFNVPFYFLKNLGLWQEKESSWFYRLYGVLLHVFLMVIPTFCHSIYLYNMFIVGSIEDLSDVLSFLLSFFGVTFKAIWFVTSLMKIKEILTTLRDLLELTSFDRVDKRPKLMANAVHISRVVKIFLFSSYVSIGISAIITFIHYKNKQLPYETWFFFDVRDNDFVYWSFLVYQRLTVFYGIPLNYSFDLISVILFSYASSLLEELSVKISLIENGEKAENSEACKKFKIDKLLVVDDENFDELKMLQKCIDCHIRIRNFSNEVSRYLTFPFMMQAFISTIVLCTSAFILTSVSIHSNLIMTTS